MKRPLVQIGLIYVAGILLGEWVRLPVAPLLVLALAVAGAAILLENFRAVLLWSLVLLTGWTNDSVHRNVISPFDLRVEFGDKAEITTLRGKLLMTPKEKRFVWDEEESWRSVAELQVQSYKRKGEWLPAFGKVFVSTPDRLPAAFFKGQVVEILGVISQPRQALADGLMDYRRYLQRQGIYYQLQTMGTNDWTLVETGRVTPLSDRFISWTKKALAAGLPDDDTTHLLWTLVLDWKAVFTDEAEEPFMRAGTYHIFAVDGLRIAIMTGILLGVLRLMRVPRVICGLIIIPLIWFYTGVTDWPASAIRASTMMTIVVGSWSLQRPSDLFNSLFAAALILLLWEPQQLFQAGFQLSFFVVLCIALLYPVLENLRKRLLSNDPFLPDELRPWWRKQLDIPIRYLFDILISSWAAWVGSIPLAAYYFHLFTPVSTPANFLVIPLTFLALISCLMSLLFFWVAPVAEIFNCSSWGLMKAITWLSEWSAKWPAAFSYVSTPSLLTIATFYLFLLAFHTQWFWKSQRKVPFAVALALVALAWVGFEIHEKSLTRIHVLPLSGGHAVFVDTPRAKDALLVDCGNEASAEFVVKPFLRAHGINRLPTFVLTHGDIRYIGGANIIATNFFPARVLTSPVRARSAGYREFLNIQRQAERSADSTISAGQRCGLWTVMHPTSGEHFSQADDNAIVLKGEFGRTRVLLCSDLGRSGQRAVLSRTNALAAEILVTGLPRKDEPVSMDFLAASSPKLVLVADSEKPATERASAKLRERLASQEFSVMYARDSGSFLVEFDGMTYKITTAK